MHTITIDVEGGVVHDVQGIPPDLQIRVRDSDVEGVDEGRVTRDESGAFVETFYGPQTGAQSVSFETSGAAHVGVGCPNCGPDAQVDGGSAEFDQGDDGIATVHQDVSCLSCERRWCQTFSFTCYAPYGAQAQDRESAERYTGPCRGPRRRTTMKYKVTWTEHHEIEVEAADETKALEEAATLAGQKDTTVDQDDYSVVPCSAAIQE